MAQAVAAVVSSDPSCLDQARALARRLDIPLHSALAPSSSSDVLLLVCDSNGLALRAADSSVGDVRVDFVGGRLGYRRAHGELRSDLAKAIGLRPGVRPRVWDLTAGLGQDAFVLAALGCEVTMVERNPVVHALLDDGLSRARRHAAIVDADLQDVLARIRLCAAESVDLLRSATQEQLPQVIYLDPMFPPRRKSAQVNKNMQLFHRLVAHDADAERVLVQALQLDVHRVVVKRPRHAPPLGDISPPLQFTGKALRFDVYPKKKLI